MEKKVLKKRPQAYYAKIKPKAMLGLIRSNVNYEATSQKYEISVATLKKWFKEYKDQHPSDNIVAMADANTAVEISKMRMEFAGEMYPKLKTLANQVVDRAIDLIQYESDLDKISRASKIVTDMANALFKEDKQGDGIDSNMQKITLIEQSIVQLNQSLSTQDNMPKLSYNQ